MTKEDKFSTRSLQIAAFLFTRREDGVELLGFDETDVRNIHFEFTPAEKCIELEDKYLFNKIDCKPRILMDSFNVLKEKVFQIQRKKRGY